MTGPALAITRGDLTTAVWGNYDMQHLQSALGVVALLVFAWAIRERRGDWRSAGRDDRHRPVKLSKIGDAIICLRRAMESPLKQIGDDNAHDA
jgi:hypothetical protein